MIFGIVCKEDNTGALDLSGRVREWIKAKGFECLVEDHLADHIGIGRTRAPWDDADLLIAIGGDGTFLRAIWMSAPRQIPILGVHMGYLGFLTEVTEDEVCKALEAVLSGDFVKEERTMFECVLVREGQEIISQHVLNDVVINKSALARMIDIEVSTDSTFITCYRA
ncbi:MAG: NAD(+)/NADH kinase, partial [Bacteriovoracaceae bacterium]|nr:NAD(+)/NADH kinase [Bacteriovoracaceae bacterium]